MTTLSKLSFQDEDMGYAKRNKCHAQESYHTPKFQFWDVNIFSNVFVHHLYILKIIQILLAFVLNFL